VLEDIAQTYQVQAQQEYTAMRGPLENQMREILGEKAKAHFIENWRALTVVLDNGELRPSRFRAHKPE
jgi:phosphoethanolamine N-methyltransferase